MTIFTEDLRTFLKITKITEIYRNLLKINFNYFFIRIKRSTFEKLAALIPKFFLSEKSDIFFTTDSKKYTGKLYSAYRTHRNKYAILGVLKEDDNTTLEEFGMEMTDNSNSNESQLTNIPLVVSCQLEKPEDLKNLIFLENRSILLKYKKDGEFDNSFRETLSNLVITTEMKKCHTINYK